MDEKLLILAIAVTASGCIHSSVEDPASIKKPGTGSSSASGDLKVETFRVSDSTLSPGQNGIITVNLKNYHKSPVSIKQISLYNTGVLEVEKLGCSPEQIKQATEGFRPGMECRWRVSMPSREQGAFESRTIPVKLNLVYTAELSNSGSPIKVHVKPLEEIDRVSEVRKSFSNGEVKMKVETESHVPVQGTRTVEITASNVGPGRVDGGYTFDYTPSTLLSDCPAEPEPVVQQKVTFSCDLKGDSEATRNLVFSTSYKYVKAPTLDIEVVTKG
ncbi:MAG: hypothetical protein ABEJ56_05855 [Candidatus Nanohaloarchaea archaeon]